MRPTAGLLLLLALCGFAAAIPAPQDEVSADDVFGDGTRTSGYTNDGEGDDDLVDELFGINNNNNNNDNDDESSNLQDDEGPYSDDNTQNDDDGSYNEEDGGEGSANLAEEYEPPPPENQEVDDRSEVCSFYEEDGYQCVPYYQCDELGEIITDGGPGLIDIRGNFGDEIQVDPENSKCEGYLEVCCRHPDFALDPIKPKPQPYVSRCGNRNVNGIGVRIQNDPYEASTQFGEWPHMCAVLEHSADGRNLYVCGASLIAPGIVMTAAHCVHKLTDADLKVRCGEWDTQQTVEPAPHQDRDVKYVNVHPAFSPRNLTNNVALLHTYEEFVISAHVDTICLPDPDDLQQSYNWEECFGTGWGKDKFDKSGEYQTILKQVELSVVSHYDCTLSLQSTRLGGNFKLDPTALCAGGVSGVDTCKGDGGGPLVCPVRGSASSNGGAYGSPDDVPQYVQAGIVGWGIGCGKDGIPGVYTDVASMLCFIDWATRCVEGDGWTDYYAVAGCENWADDEIAKLQATINILRQKKRAVSGRKRKARLDRHIKVHQRAKKKYTDLADQCGQFDFEDYGDDLVGDDEDPEDPDLGGYTRTGTEGGDDDDAQ